MVSPEARPDSPSNETTKPVDFHNPLTNRAKTLEKLTALSKKEEPTDEELFQAIADTFATMATIDFEAGVVETVGNKEFKALDWEHTDEMVFQTPKSDLVTIGYFREQGDGEQDRIEESFIQDYSSEIKRPESLELRRDIRDGSISFHAFDFNGDDKEIESLPALERTKIIKTLLDGINSHQLVAS